jgi:hypothetical protein
VAVDLANSPNITIGHALASFVDGHAKDGVAIGIGEIEDLTNDLGFDHDGPPYPSGRPSLLNGKTFPSQWKINGETFPSEWKIYAIERE